MPMQLMMHRDQHLVKALVTALQDLETGSASPLGHNSDVLICILAQDASQMSLTLPHKDF